MGAQVSKEESDIGSSSSGSSGVNNNNNIGNIKKERRYTTNSGNLHFLYQQEEGIGINYKTGSFNNSSGISSNNNNLKESSSLDDLESITTTSLSISSSTPPPLEINYSSSNNSNSNNNNKSNKSVHFTRTRSRSLNISKANYKSNDPPTPLNNSFNSGKSTPTLEQTTSSNTAKLSSSSLTSSSSTSSLSSSISTSSNTTKGEKIQGRKSKSSNALFKTLKASFNGNSSSNNKERDRSASISSSNSSSTNSLIIEKQPTSKSSKQKKSPNTSTESLSLSANTSSSSLSSVTPPLYQKSNSFSKSQNTSTDSLGSSSNSNKNSGSSKSSKRNSKEVSLDSSKLSSKPIDNNSTDNNNNNNNQTILIDKLTDQLHKDPFFKNTNNNSESLQAQQPPSQPLPSSSLPPQKKQPPPLPPKNFKPTTNMISNPPSPQQPYVNSNNNSNSGNNLTKLSNGYYALKKSSSISNSSFPPIEPTYPSETSSKRSSVEIKYLEENHKYTITDRLGSGAFSDVYCCISKETKKQYAIKIIDKSLVAMISAHTDMKITTEVDILKSSFHPHVIQIFDHFETETYYYIVTELLQGGELLYQLEKNHPSTNNTVSNYTEEHARKIIKQVVQAVSFLHSNNIVHRDLKPENILFRDRSMGSILKIIDFGLATYVESNSNTLIDVCGTPEFQAPEMVKRETGYSFPVDIWSTGIILYILLCGHPPFYGKNNMIIMSLIIKGQFSFDAENGWDNVSELAKDLIRKMLNPDPSQRLTANQVLEHEWITTAIDENGSPQLGAPFGRQLRRYNSHRNFKQIGDTLLRSQRYLYLNNETNSLKRRSIQL